MEKFIKMLNPDGKQGGLLMGINILSMVFAAIANTYAAAKDKNTSAEDKKFLVPAGIGTGAANIGLYYLLTKKVIIKGCENSADKFIKNLSDKDVAEKALEYANSKIEKSSKGIFKEKPEVISSMKKTLIDNGKATQIAKDEYKANVKAAASVLGAFSGAVISCAILTPIIRDTFAYFTQKKMAKNNPNKEIPPMPYLTNSLGKTNKNGGQPLTIKNYMAYTSGSMKI